MFIENGAWLLEKVIEYSLASFASWSSFTAALGKVAGTFTDLESGMAWPYLLASLLIAAGVFAWGGWADITRRQAFGAFLFPRHVYLHSSAILDYKFHVINVFMKFLFYVPIMVGMGTVGYKAMSAVVIGYLSWEPPTSLSTTEALGAAFGFFMLYDFINYCSHVLFHKIPVLWAFHRVHHSAQVLTPITAFRGHPMELFFPAFLQMPVIGLAAVFYQNVSPRDMEVATIFGIGVFTFIFGLVGHHLQHSHVWLSFGPVLSRVYVSPAQHQIHHSVDPRHRDKNFGVKFAVWDVLFGTLYVPKFREAIQVGLPKSDTREFRKVSELYFRPFADVFGDFTMSADKRG
jgi:sterol desaturase/sphingolipid hydroxylase (fatty acid hydroxylase superfamily)